MSNSQTWNVYYMTNDHVLELLSMLNCAPESRKKKIQESLIDQLSYLVYKRVQGYKSSQFYNDLIQEGKIGLLKSIEDFDPIRGLNFFKFAIWHIQHRINVYLKYQQRFEKERCRQRNIVSDTFVTSPHELFEKHETIKVLNDVVGTLSEMESKIVMMRFGICGSTKHTLQQIGDIFSVSKQYIKQVESKAICRLKRNRTILDFYEGEYDAKINLSK